MRLRTGASVNVCSDRLHWCEHRFAMTLQGELSHGEADSLTCKERRGFRPVSFYVFLRQASLDARASSASVMASSKEGWGRMTRRSSSAVWWFTMAALI